MRGFGERPGDACRADEGAAALLAQAQALVHQRGDRLANGDARNAVGEAEFRLARNAVAVLEVEGDEIAERVLELQPEWRAGEGIARVGRGGGWHDDAIAGRISKAKSDRRRARQRTSPALGAAFPRLDAFL